MRLFLMFLPIIWSPALEVSDSALLSVIIKCIISYGAVTAVSRVNGILTGILADSAGWQAISAGDMRGNVQNSALGKTLGAMSISNVGKGIYDKTAGKALSKAGGALKDATVGKVYSKITGKDMKSGEKTAAQKTKDERQRQRQMKDLKANIKYAEDNGKTLDGKKATEKDISRMQHTLDHMENDKMDFDDARKSAAQDMKQDKLDAKQEGKHKTQRLKNPPPVREDAPLPENQSNQVD